MAKSANFYLYRIFSFLDVISLCRCARVSRYWNLLALDGSNWQKVDLFDFQVDIEVNRLPNVVEIINFDFDTMFTLFKGTSG